MKELISSYKDWWHSRFVGILFIAFSFSALDQGITAVSNEVIVSAEMRQMANSTSTNGTSTLHLQATSSLPLWPSILSFTILLVSLFVFYRVGNSVDLKNNYLRVAVCLFVGGSLGGNFGLIVVPMLMMFSECSLGLATGCSFGNFLVLPLLVILEPLSLGYALSMLFRGFFAIALANFRKKPT